MATRIKAWPWKGSLTGFLRSVAVAAASAIAISALLFAAVTSNGEFGLTSEATAAQAVAEPHIEAHQRGHSVAPGTAESNLDFLAKAALWNSTGVRLEARDGQSAAE